MGKIAKYCKKIDGMSQIFCPESFPKSSEIFKMLPKIEWSEILVINVFGRNSCLPKICLSKSQNMINLRTLFWPSKLIESGPVPPLGFPPFQEGGGLRTFGGRRISEPPTQKPSTWTS